MAVTAVVIGIKDKLSKLFTILSKHFMTVDKVVAIMAVVVVVVGFVVFTVSTVICPSSNA